MDGNVRKALAETKEFIELTGHTIEDVSHISEDPDRTFHGDWGSFLGRIADCDDPDAVFGRLTVDFYDGSYISRFNVGYDTHGKWAYDDRFRNHTYNVALNTWNDWMKNRFVVPMDERWRKSTEWRGLMHMAELWMRTSYLSMMGDFDEMREWYLREDHDVTDRYMTRAVRGLLADTGFGKARYSDILLFTIDSILTTMESPASTGGHIESTLGRFTLYGNRVTVDVGLSDDSARGLPRFDVHVQDPS